jgi:dihydrolipoamide dehydrogenase
VSLASDINIDVMILGAGGGGYPAAFRLASAGLQVVMVDPIGNLGGDCLAEGCVPSKAVREAGLARAGAGRFPLFGLRGTVPAVEWPDVLRHKDRVQSLRYAQHQAELRAATLIFHHGAGQILDDHRIEVTTANGNLLRYRARHLIIATGSRPHRLAIPGADLAITSHDVFRLHADLPFPSRLVAIGAGYIGLETASMLQNLGAEVVVLEATDQVLPGVDPALASFLHTALGRRMTIVTNAKVTGISRDSGGELRVRFEVHGEEQSLCAQCVLMATGREPVAPAGIDAIGLPASGKIDVDTRLRTKLSNIYAPGDVNGRSMLFHSAVLQSWTAAGDILSSGHGTETMNFQAVPFTVFTEPEVAWVGLSEADAAAQCLKAASSVYDYRNDARAQIFAEMDGFIKLVFATDSSRLIGAQIAGLDAAQTVAPLAFAVHVGASAEALRSMAFPHPMITEGINKAARAFVS